MFYAVLIALLTGISAGLAGQLAATKTWHKWVFWGTGSLIVLLVYFQTRSYKEPPTAGEIAAAIHYPTAAEIAQAASQIVPTQNRAPNTPKAPAPEIKLIFKDSPLLTEARKRNITKAINEAYSYLVNLGFPLEKEVPPLCVSPYNVQSMSGVFPGTIYERQIYLPHNSLDDPNTIRRVYLSYVFGMLFHSIDGGALSDQATRTTVAFLFTDYCASSIAGKNLDSGEWRGHNWMQAVWEIRQRQGQAATDRYMYYAYRTWDVDPTKPSGAFEDVFLTRFLAGVWIKDNFGTSIASVEPILGKYKLTKPN